MTFTDAVTSVKTLAQLVGGAGGDVSWGTETGEQPIVFGANAGDIDSDTNLTWNTTTDILDVTGGASISGSAVNLTGLGTDETEVHVVGIDNSTGLLSKISIGTFSSGSWTFDSGITESGGNIDIGGALTSNVTFTGASTYDMIFGTEASPVNYFTVNTDNDIELNCRWSGSDQEAYLRMDSYGAQYLDLCITDSSSNVMGLNLLPGSFTIIDAINSTGLLYATDYSSGAGNRWITDKEYVDGVSDRQLKENIVAVTDSVLPGLKTLDTYTFNLKKDPDKVRRYGLMAQDVIKVFPEAVHEMDEGFLSVRYKELVAVTISGLNEVVAIQESHEQKIKRLTKRVLTLEKKLKLAAN